ncbi:MAG: hypothetical protein HQL38_20785 [Alphaproteobacteria bacterium]|nr:hypothetical protein [Alphaproteobacteria bacterium]
MADMDKKPQIQAGQFVRCQFPYQEDYRVPDPKEHIGFVLFVDSVKIDGKPVDRALVAYTTSIKDFDPNRKYQDGTIPFSPSAAKRLGQEKPFLLDLLKTAWLPVNKRFFPLLDNPERLVVKNPEQTQCQANGFLSKIVEKYVAVRQKQVPRVVLGPLVPQQERHLTPAPRAGFAQRRQQEVGQRPAVLKEAKPPVTVGEKDDTEPEPDDGGPGPK